MFGVIGSEAEAGSPRPLEGVGSTALKAATLEADVTGGC